MGRYNYFQALKIYNQALKIYFQAMKINYQALKIILLHVLGCFISGISQFYSASWQNCERTSIIRCVSKPLDRA